MKYKLDIEISQKLADGSKVLIQSTGKCKIECGNIDDVVSALLEAERFGNAGKARIHIFLCEQ